MGLDGLASHLLLGRTRLLKLCLLARGKIPLIDYLRSQGAGIFLIVLYDIRLQRIGLTW